MALDPRIPTVSLQMARNLLAQPESDPLGLDELQKYDSRAEENAFVRNLPDFFRQMAQQIARYNEVAQAQRAEFEARMAGSSAGGMQVDEDDTFMPTRSAQFRSAYGMTPEQMVQQQQQAALQQQVELQQQAALQQPIAETGTQQVTQRAGTGLAAPSLGGTRVGRFFGGLKDIATDVLAPVGHAVEAGIEATGRGVQTLPGGKRIGTALEMLPTAAAKFKETFGEEFEKKTGQPLGFETAIAAINKYGLQDTANRLARASDVVLTDYTIDPILHATLPDWAADPIVKGMGFAASALPYVAISILNPQAGLALGTTFALSATEDVKNLTAEYRRGNIDGKTFALGVGLGLLDIMPEVAAPLVYIARRGFANRRALADAIEQIDTIKTEAKTEGAPVVGERAGLVKSMEELDTEAVARAVDRGDKRPAGELVEPEQRAAMDAEMAETVAPTTAPTTTTPAVEITETPRTPIEELTGRHRLTTPEGDRLDWRETPEGAHIQDVTVQVERRGTGTALLNRAIADIRAQNPDAVITADLNSEGGARLFARQGAEFTDINGRTITPEEAIDLAARRKQPIAILRPTEATQPEATIAATQPEATIAATQPETTVDVSALDNDPGFRTFEEEVNASVEEMVAPPVAGAVDEVGNDISVATAARRALEDEADLASLDAPVRQRAVQMRDELDTHLAGLSTDDLKQMVRSTQLFHPWQIKRAEAEIVTREASVNNSVAAFSQSDPNVQQALRGMGYEHLPMDPVETARVHQALDELNTVNSIPALQDWMSKNATLLEQPISTGADSQFRISGKFDFEAARNELRAQARRVGKLNDLDGTERPLADAIGARKTADLGNCAMKAVRK